MKDEIVGSTVTATGEVENVERRDDDVIALTLLVRLPERKGAAGRILRRSQAWMLGLAD